MKATEKKVTIREVSVEGGVSFKTVSRVLNGEAGVRENTRDRVIEVAKKLGYRRQLGAVLMRGVQSGIVSLVIPFQMTSPEYYVGEVLRGLCPVLSSAGKRVLLDIVGDTGEESYSSRESLSEGVIILAPRDGAPYLDAIESKRISAVSLHTKTVHIPFVDLDNESGARQIARHLLKTGKKNFLYLGGEQLTGFSRERRRAFVDEISKNGQGMCGVRYCDMTEEGGRRALAEWLECEPAPDAVFAATDLIAVGAMAEAKNRGYRVPEDMAFAGFDGSVFGRMTEPSLTTVEQQISEMGSLAGELLIKQMRGEEVKSVLVQGVFRKGGSTGIEQS